MTFADLPAGASVFLDASPFIFHFTDDPTFKVPSTELIARIERKELVGFSSTHVLGEVMHRLMTIEALAAFGWPYKGIAQRLRRHPAEVQKLSRYQTAIVHVLNSQLQILTISLQSLADAAVVSRQTGLLTNDSLVVVLTRAHGLVNLASADRDFDAVPGIHRYAPA